MLLTTVQSSQRGYVITGDDAYLEPYQDALGRLDQTVRDLRSLTGDSAAQQRRLATLEPLIQSRLALAREAIAIRRANGLDAAATATKTGQGETNMDDIRNLLGDMQGDEDALLETRVAQAQADASNAKWTILLGTLSALIVAVVAAIAITRTIAGPLRNLTGVAERITMGDLRTSVAPDSRNDELGMLARAFGLMTESLRAMAVAAERIAAGDLRSTTTVEEVRQTAQVANQKAGEHGKGFGVVAQEVKSLAEQSRQATTQVRTILGDIQKATATAVLATEQGSKAVDAGTRHTEVAGEAIQTLAGSVSEAAQAATQIAASSQQQLVGVDQVAAAMDSIKQASTQNVASATQLEAAARTLNALGQRLTQMVERYQA